MTDRVTMPSFTNGLALDRAVHNIRVGQAVFRVVHRIWYLADDLETDAFPEVYGDRVGFYDKIELHRGKAKSFGFFQRPKGYLFAYAFSVRAGRDHVSCVADVLSKAGLVGTEPECRNHLAVEFGDVIVFIRREPIRHHLFFSRIRRKYISIAASDNGFDNLPYRGSIAILSVSDLNHDPHLASSSGKLKSGRSRLSDPINFIVDHG